MMKEELFTMFIIRVSVVVDKALQKSRYRKISEPVKKFTGVLLYF